MTHPQQFPDYLRTIVATFIRREVDFPAETLVSVTRVTVSPQKRHATVWVSVLPSERAEEMLTLLNEHLYALQGMVNAHVHLRPVPRLHFRTDPGLEYAARIDTLTSLNE